MAKKTTAPKPQAAKPQAPKAATPKPSKPTPKAAKPAAKASAGGLTMAQRRALDCLAKAKNGLNRNQLTEKTGQVKGWSKLLGAARKGAADDSLMGLGYITAEQHEGDRAMVYSITAAGRKALAAG